jgi:hypothetical protein
MWRRAETLSCARASVPQHVVDRVARIEVDRVDIELRALIREIEMSLMMRAASADEPAVSRYPAARP